MFYQLKITLRNLRQNGLYSAINIGGLAVSLAAVILTFLWVRGELNYNHGFRNADRIYQIDYSSPLSLAPFVAQNIPEVEQVCRTCNRFDLGVLTYGEDKFTLTDVYVADSSFFSVFGISAIEGNASKPFEDKHSLVLTQSLAHRIFKDADPVGKLIQSSAYGTLHVTAVIPDMPQNSSLQYKAILPFSFYSEVNKNLTSGEDWYNGYFTTYALVAGGVDTKKLGDKISHAVWTKLNPGEEYNPQFWMKCAMLHFTTMHLYSSDGAPTGIKNVRLFSIIAFALLLIAAINYVNLVTARLVIRTKEAGIRKTLGSGRMRLFMQMMQESSVMFVIALAIATLLVNLVLPFYNELTGKEFRFDILSTETIVIYIVLFITISLLAGIYPALMITKFRPVGLLSTHTSKPQKSLLRKSLVVLQFTFSVGLIFMMVALGAQLKYMRDKDPGYEKENIFYVRMHQIKNDGYLTVRNELLKQSAISDVTATRMPINDSGWGLTNEFVCKDGSKQFTLYAYWGDYNMLDFFGIHLLTGQNFKSDERQFGGIIINRELAGQLGWDDILGRSLPMFNGPKEIIGEMNNINFQSLHEPIGPMAVFYLLDDVDYLYVKTVPGKTGAAITAVENIWKRYNDGYPFEIHFFDQEFDRMYQSDIRTGKLFTAFAIVAILISCLGLFGLVTYTAETKTKEIGIRKVLGARVSNIVNMLSKEFLMLVGIALLIAFPLAYYWIDKMLQDYAYHISIGIWMFVLAGVITIGLTLITVGWQAIKAATANPVKAIKSE